MRDVARVRTLGQFEQAAAPGVGREIDSAHALQQRGEGQPRCREIPGIRCLAAPLVQPHQPLKRQVFRRPRQHERIQAEEPARREMALQQAHDDVAIGLRHPRPHPVRDDDVEDRQVAPFQQFGEGGLHRTHAGSGATREVPGRRDMQRIDVAAPVLAGTSGSEHVDGGAQAEAEVEVAQLASSPDRAASEQAQQRRRLLGPICRLECDIGDVAVDLHPPGRSGSARQFSRHPRIEAHSTTRIASILQFD